MFVVCVALWGVNFVELCLVGDIVCEKNYRWFCFLKMCLEFCIHFCEVTLSLCVVFERMFIGEILLAFFVEWLWRGCASMSDKT